MIEFSVAKNFSPKGIDDLQEVRGELVCVNNWFDLGLALKLKHHTLKGIKADYVEEAACKREMLVKWLTQVDGCHPTWITLVVALRDRNCTGLSPIADQIEKNYGVAK